VQEKELVGTNTCSDTSVYFINWQGSSYSCWLLSTGLQMSSEESDGSGLYQDQHFCYKKLNRLRNRIQK